MTVAKAIYAVAGKSCERDQLAAHFNVAASDGGFNLKLLTAKLFGFINSDGKGSLNLTALESRVCDPQQEKAARAESFLLVPLYKAVYEDYKGQMLPGNPGLEAAMSWLKNIAGVPKLPYAVQYPTQTPESRGMHYVVPASPSQRLGGRRPGERNASLYLRITWAKCAAFHGYL